MTTQMKHQTLVSLGNPHVDTGYEYGRCWYFHGDNPQQPVTWEQVVQFIYNNILESELALTPELIIDYIGFVVGWISGQCIPEE